MNFSGSRALRRAVGASVGTSLIGLVLAMMAAPAASAAPDCSPAGVSSTVSSTTASAQQFLQDHPGAGQVTTAAYTQPTPEAAANIRSYFTAHPQEYYQLRGILAPIGDTQRQCNVSVLPPNLSAAYAEFMAG